MKNPFFYLYLLLLVLVTSMANARATGLAVVGNKYVLGASEPKSQDEQGDKSTAQRSEQTSAEPPVKSVPMTERKSKPQRVDERSTGSARGPREVRSARGGRGSEAGRGAQSGGRGAGRGVGRGRNN